MILILTVLVWNQMACDKPEPIPAYLYIEAIELEVATDGSEGSASHDIVDAWVYVNGEHIGVFELPAHIPVLHEGLGEVTVLAGIKKNGQANDRIIYPFYTAYITERELIPGTTDSLAPVVGYRASSVFAWKEDFENGVNSMERSGLNSTVDSMVLTSDPALVHNYNGTTSRITGMATLDSGFQVFEFRSKQQFELPRQQTAVFLEFNYRCDVNLDAGFYPLKAGEVNAISVVKYYPTDQWRKAYVSLTEDLNAANLQNVDVHIFFGAFKASGDEPKRLYIDNIKLIHF